MTIMCILKEDKGLTENAKLIFGEDLVSAAYYVENYYEHKKDDVKHRERILKSFEYNAEKNKKIVGEIEQDGMNIVIDFKNGKSVYFSNSEWGAMDSYDHKNMTIEKIS